MRQKKVMVKGKEISFYESRDNGHPVVLVHGMSSSSSIFIRQLIDSVLSYQFRFIALDLLGHGNSGYSDNPNEEYTIKGLSDFLINFNEELNIEGAVYVGHNFGANIILEAFEGFKNPKGIALLGSTPLPNPIQDNVFNEGVDVQLFSKAGIDDSEVHQLAGFFVEEGTKYPDFIPEIIRKSDKKTREVLFGSIKKGEYKGQIELIKQINVPIAVYYGEFDRIINFDFLNSIEIPAIWRNIIQIIRDTGQMFFYESPADFNVSFEAFLFTAFNK